MTAIVQESDVVVHTMYDSIGPKRAILLALISVMDDDADTGVLWEEIEDQSDPAFHIARGANLTRQFHKRSGDLIRLIVSATPIEPDATEALAERVRRHQAGTRQMARCLTEQGMLRPELPVTRAGDLFGFLTSIPVYHQLTLDYGWTLDECQEWMTATLITLLLLESHKHSTVDS